MMMAIVDPLWLRIHATLSALSQKLSAMNPLLTCDLRRMQNDAFLLMGYLGVRRSGDGEEVAITVDVQSDGKWMTIQSDVCKDDGTILSTGPSVEIRLSEDESGVQHAVDDWVSEFEQFLSKSEPEIVSAVSRLA